MSQAAKKISQFEKILEDKKAHPTEAPIYWFIARGSTLKGPFTIDELQEKLETNDVTIYDYAWRQGFSEWRNLGSVSEIQKKNPTASFEAYPNIPVPGKTQVAPTSNKEETHHQSNAAPKKRRDIEVRLRAAGKSWFTVRQSFFMVLFAIGVAHTTVSWFQNKLHKNIQSFFQTRHSGTTLTVGVPNSATTSSHVWAPLYSAPSYNEVKENLKLPVSEFGFVNIKETGYKMGALSIEKPQGDVLNALEFSELDPIFIRPVQAHGHLNPSHPLTFRLDQPGEPYKANFWNRP
jgi:hypothetical protein